MSGDREAHERMKKGIFWCRDFQTERPALITVSARCGADGVCAEAAAFSSKSGENFNHKAEWARLDRRVTQGRPYNYYPRGRVEIKNGRATVFLHPELCTERIVEMIAEAFELRPGDGLRSIRCVADGSAHYRCVYSTAL